MIEKLLESAKFLICELKSGEHTMDVEGFLIASGLALMVVLLGWASQITSKSKETKELEADFLQKAKLRRPAYKKIINEAGSTEDSLFALVDFLYDKERQEGDIEIFEKIKLVRSGLGKLDDKYDSRFWVLVSMSMSFFITGIIAFFLPAKDELWVALPNVVFVVVVFVNLIEVHNLEKRYIKDIRVAMENL